MRDRTEARHHLEFETFDTQSLTLFLSRGRELSWSSPRGSVSCFLLSTVRVAIHVWQSRVASLETPHVVLPRA